MRKARDRKERVIIDGICNSACTLVLGIVPLNRICVTPRASLGFHRPITQALDRRPAGDQRRWHRRVDVVLPARREGVDRPQGWADRADEACVQRDGVVGHRRSLS